MPASEKNSTCRARDDEPQRAASSGDRRSGRSARTEARAFECGLPGGGGSSSSAKTNAARPTRSIRWRRRAMARSAASSRACRPERSTATVSTARGRFPTRPRASSRDGVHGPSRGRRPAPLPLDRRAAGAALALDDLVLYELHVGTFTPEGTFAGVDGSACRTCARSASPPSS